MAEHDDERLVRLVGPAALARIGEAIAAGQGRPAKQSELELVVDWIAHSWATEALVAGVLGGTLTVRLKNGELSFRGRTVAGGRLQ